MTSDRDQGGNIFGVTWRDRILIEFEAQAQGANDQNRHQNNQRPANNRAMPLEGLRASHTFGVRHSEDTVPAEGTLEQAIEVIEAGHGTDEASLNLLTTALRSENALLRRHALTGLEARLALSDATIVAAIADHDAENRARALRVAGRVTQASSALIAAVTAATSDSQDFVAVAAIRSIADLVIGDALDLLVSLVREHQDPMVREEAVAALGSLGDEHGLIAIIEACSDKPAVRRRCVVALGAFQGDAVEAALDRLNEDKDWQVRQAVAMLRRAELD